MPTDISNAIGTARQFTPQPDAGYIGRYRELSPANVSVSMNHIDTLAQNMQQLTTALSSYTLSHEKYLKDMGETDAERMVRGESEESIRKLNAVDAAQQEGYADSLSNPYFKAHAERLRGGFLSSLMKNEYDAKYAFDPARTSKEEAKRYFAFSKDWQDKNLSGDSAPVYQRAFSMGFNESQLVNTVTLMSTWEKKKYEDDVKVTLASASNQLSEIIKESPTLLQENGAVTQRAQEVFNNLRLMGLPVEYRVKLAQDFFEEFISTGHIDAARLEQMAENITIRTNIDGSEEKLSKMLPMMQYKTLAAEYNKHFYTQEKYDLVEKYAKQGRVGLQNFMKFIEELRVTHPEKARELNPLYPQIVSKVEQQENEAKQRRIASARAKGMKAGGEKRGSVSDPDTAAGVLQAVVKGATHYDGLPLNDFTFDKGVLHDVALHMIASHLQQGDFDSVSRLMDYQKLGALKETISDGLNSKLAGIRPTDDGGVNIGSDTQVFQMVQAMTYNQGAVENTFGGELAKNIRLIKLFTDTYGDAYGQGEGFNHGLRLFAEMKQTEKNNPDLYNAFKAQAQNNMAGFQITGVANPGGYNDMADFGYARNSFVRDELAQFQTALLAAGYSQDDAIRETNNLVRKNYVTYHWGVFPRSVYWNMGTGNDADYFTQALNFQIYQTIGVNDAALAETVSITYNPNTRMFRFESAETGKTRTVSVQELRRIGQAKAREDTDTGEAASNMDMDNLTMSVADINEARERGVYVPEDTYIDPSFMYTHPFD